MTMDHFDLIAGVYDCVLGPPNVRRVADLLRLPTDGWILDAGGGTGRVSSHLRPLAGGVVVSDFSRRMLMQAGKKKGLSPVRARTERLPFPDATFDRVLVVDALHHFHDQQESLADLVRVLKPGGRLFIEEPDLNLLVVKLVAVLERLFLMRSHFYTPAKIQTLVNALGLSTRIAHDGRFRAWILADK